jgi:hypothetical protein
MLVLFDNGTPRTLTRYLIDRHTITEARARGWEEKMVPSGFKEILPPSTVNDATSISPALAKITGEIWQDWKRIEPFVRGLPTTPQYGAPPGLGWIDPVPRDESMPFLGHLDYRDIFGSSHDLQWGWIMDLTAALVTNDLPNNIGAYKIKETLDDETTAAVLKGTL